MKIPKEAKNVFSGIIFNVYQWKQKMFDNSLQMFEMTSRAPSTDVIAVVNNKIIILLQQQPGRSQYYSLPGGRVEKNHTPLASAQRELLEETGYKASLWKLIAEWFGDSKIYFHESLFVAQSCKKVAQPKLDAGEKIKVTFMDFNDFIALCRRKDFVAPSSLKFMMYEALLDQKKKENLKRILFS